MFRSCLHTAIFFAASFLVMAVLTIVTFALKLAGY